MGLRGCIGLFAASALCAGAIARAAQPELNLLDAIASKKALIELGGRKSMKAESDAQGRLRTRSIDTDGDGRPDMTDYFDANGHLVRRERDLNHDGIPDEITEFSDGRVVTRIDTRFRGRFDHVEEETFSGAWIVTKVSVDPDESGDFKRVYYLREPRDQRDDHAGGVSTKASPGEELIARVHSADAKLGPSKEGLRPTGYGPRVEDSCVELFGGEPAGALRFGRILRESLDQGLSCLKNLGTRDSLSNLQRFASLLNGQPPPLIRCSEKTGYDWTSTHAHATSPGDKEHPLLSLNPTTSGKQADGEVRTTVFHEFFHNLGFLHHRDVDFPYACETCCTPTDKLTRLTVDAGCKICKGGYTSTRDPAYLEDLAQFSALTFQSKLATRTLANLLAAHPEDRNLRFQYVRNLSPTHNPALALAFREVLSKSYGGKDPSEGEKKILAEGLETYQHDPTAQALLPEARALAAAQFALWNNKPQEAEEALRQLARLKVPAEPPESPAWTYFREDLQALRKDLGWKIYDYYRSTGPEHAANTDESTRVYNEFLKDRT